MPSWNIHTAHAECLFSADGPVSRVVRDRNAFLFGNLIPDIYVGYMVPSIASPIPYRTTHFANPEHIPKPRFEEFWDRYVEPALNGLDVLSVLAGGVAPDGGCTTRPYWQPISISAEVERVSPTHKVSFENRVDPLDVAAMQRAAFEQMDVPLSEDERAVSLFDMLVGTWVHLLADCIWNQRVSDVLVARGEKPSSGFRIKKQADFDLFGKSLAIDLVPRATPQLIEVAVAFPQYPIDEHSVFRTEAVAHETVRTNYLTSNRSTNCSTLRSSPAHSMRSTIPLTACLRSI